MRWSCSSRPTGSHNNARTSARTSASHQPACVHPGRRTRHNTAATPDSTRPDNDPPVKPPEPAERLDDESATVDEENEELEEEEESNGEPVIAAGDGNANPIRGSRST